MSDFDDCTIREFFEYVKYIFCIEIVEPIKSIIAKFNRGNK
jgi:hypothetical protein